MKNLIIKNSLKAIIVLLSAYILFFLMIVMFPTFGSLTNKGISTNKIIVESLLTILPALIVIVPFGLILGWMSAKLKKRRILLLFLISILIYLLSIFIVVLTHSGVSILNEGSETIILIVLWAFLAYFIFIVPLLLIGIIIIERWTR